LGVSVGPLLMRVQRDGSSLGLSGRSGSKATPGPGFGE